MTYNSNNIQRPIILFLWNANGLIHQKNELTTFLLILNLDLILISEAHLTPNTSFKIPCYQTYYYDHPDGTAHAGSAILIKSDIKHFILPSFQSNSVQATNINIQINHIPTTISSVYCPPSSKLITNDFTNHLSSLGNTFLIGGDFNSKYTAWGSRIFNTRGRILYYIAVNKRLTFISPPNPTYWPTHQNRLPDTLDFFLTNLPNHINHSITNSIDLSSDHTSVLFA